MLTLLTTRLRRRPARRPAVDLLDPYAARRRVVQRVMAAELVALGEIDGPVEPHRAV